MITPDSNVELERQLDKLAEAVACLPVTQLGSELVNILQQIELQVEAGGQSASAVNAMLMPVHDRIVRRLVEAGWNDADEAHLRRMGRVPSTPGAAPADLYDQIDGIARQIVGMPPAGRSEALIRLLRRVEHHHDKADRFRINAMEFTLLALQGRILRRLVYSHWGDEPEEREFSTWR